MTTDTTNGAAPAAAADTNPQAANPNGEASTVSDASKGQGQGDNANETKGKASADADTKTGDTKADEQQGAPEQYADFTLPDGYSLDGERKEWALALFKKANMSQAVAQEFIDAYCKADSENSSVRDKFLGEQHEQKVAKWGEQAKVEFGAKYDETITLARAGVAALNRPELLAAFDAEGWGNHPEMIRVFAKLGELTRGSGLKGMESETTDNDRSKIPIEKRLYPNMA